MSARCAVVVVSSLLLAAGAAAAAPNGPTSTEGVHRLSLPKVGDKTFPYTVEVPRDWNLRYIPNSPGVWIGRKGAEPDKDPHLLYVRQSPVSLADPQKVVESIKASDEAAADWSAPLLEPREVAGVRGVLVRVDSGEGEAARSTLALKLPAPDQGSVDFLFSARRDEFAQLEPLFMTILSSVRRVESPGGR